ncbi:MAG: hypothetical protein AAF828_00335 [Bacteroidota bacterium]
MPISFCFIPQGNRPVSTLCGALVGLLFFVCCSGTLSARSWRVNNTLTAPDQVDFIQLKAAVESASVQSGDTIYVEGSSVFYEGRIEVRKQLFIIGPGYLLDQAQVQPTLCAQLPATIGNSVSIEFFPGSDGSTMTGMTTDGWVSFRGVNDIQVSRNKIDYILIGIDQAGNNISRDINITQNLICSRIEVFGGLTEAYNIYVANNLIVDGVEVSLSEVGNLTIINNTFRPQGFIDVEGATISFNYVGRIESSTVNNAITNNILSQDNQDNEDIVAQNGTNVIDPYAGDFMNCNTDDWRLQPVDQLPTHGAYNGPLPLYANPDFPANLPAIPAIYECEVDACGDETINVSFKVRSNQ